MRTLIVLTLAAALVPAASASAGWNADRTQTRAGVVSGVRTAGGNGDRITLTWARHLGSTQRAELRLGRARDGLTSVPNVLDSSPNAIEPPISTYVRDGGFAVAWRRVQSSIPRIQYRKVNRDGTTSGKFNATTTGEPAFEPAWVPGTTPALIWSRVTRADAIELSPTGLRGLRLPVPPRSEPGAATDGDGLATVSWVNDERVLVSDRAGTGFGAPFTLATGEVNTTRVARVGSATLVFWRQDTNLLVAARPPGGSFGPPRMVLASTTDAPQVAVTRTGEVLALAPTGDSSFVGQLQLARLGADGAPLGPVRVLGRGRRAQLAADGTGSAFVAWMSPSATRAITARRIAAGGIVGVPRALAARQDITSSPQLAATREGGAVLAWVVDGDVHARTYRP